MRRPYKRRPIRRPSPHICPYQPDSFDCLINCIVMAPNPETPRFVRPRGTRAGQVRRGPGFTHSAGFYFENLFFKHILSPTILGPYQRPAPFQDRRPPPVYQGLPRLPAPILDGGANGGGQQLIRASGQMRAPRPPLLSGGNGL
jgi:hypothetical protein